MKQWGKYQASQTLSNLRLIDNAVDTLILRPLIASDKEHIIKVSREIGIEGFVKTMPEYCGIFSKNPTVKAIKDKIESEEKKFDFSIMECMVRKATNVDIRDVGENKERKSSRRNRDGGQTQPQSYCTGHSRYR